MGEQIRIADLARNMIVLSGLVPEKDIAITYTGLRLGEKLYEELFEAGEEVASTAHPKINRAIGTPLSAGDLDQWMKELADKLSGSDDDELLQDLKRLVPSFQSAFSQRVS
jgi:FlaA1/EpsC-like NDP-sugar epimerase